MKDLTPSQIEIMKDMLNALDGDSLIVTMDIGEFEFDDVVAVLRSNIKVEVEGDFSVAALTEVYEFNDDEDEVTITFNSDAIKLLAQIPN